MKYEDFKPYTLGIEASIRETIQRIDETKGQACLITNEKHKLLGIVTDGDIRRFIIRGGDINEPVTHVMNEKPLVVKESTPRDEVLEFVRSRKYRNFPVVNKEGYLVGLVTLDSILGVDKKNNSVILMAGGVGSRLKPLTDNCPKPLLKVGGQPILETIIRRLTDHGLSKIFLSVNYKKQMIKDYFGDGKKFGVSVGYLEEDTPLGTAGALSLIENQFELPIIVMNGDVLTNVNFDHLLAFHEENEAAATMCVREFEYQVPYGVVNVKGHEIIDIVEKPIEKCLVNAGIYVLSPKVLQMIPKDEFFDMPSLFDLVREKKMKTTAFPIREYWTDIGQHEDFTKAEGDFIKNFETD